MTDESESPVLLTHEGPLSTITLNRPRVHNALDRATLDALGNTAMELRQRQDLRAVILTAHEGKAFGAGADIAAMADMSPAAAQAFAEIGDAVLGSIESLPVPVIAAVDGFALGGGCELALACDFIYASTRARFGQPEVKLGIVPGFGGTQRLWRRVGVGQARELIYTGRIINAQEALRIGLVNAVVEPETLLERVRQVASEIAGTGPLAVASAKSVIRKGMDHPLNEALDLEARAFGALFTTFDQGEGMAAFLAKRKPEFKGR